MSEKIKLLLYYGTIMLACLIAMSFTDGDTKQFFLIILCIFLGGLQAKWQQENKTPTIHYEYEVDGRKVAYTLENCTPDLARELTNIVNKFN